MPRRAKGPRLYLDPKRRVWVIRDGARFVRTGCGAGDSEGAEKLLAQYIGHKYRPTPTGTPMIAAVLAAYGSEIAPHRATAKDLGYVIGGLLDWWGEKPASDVTARNCREYAATKPASSAARDLKIMRAALNHWSREYGQIIPPPVVWTPAPGQARERWLTRKEAARLLSAARRHQHLRRLIVLGLYTGSRPGVILGLQWDQLDLDKGEMIRTRDGAKTYSNKRAPAVRLGKRILGHLKRWKRLDGDAVKYLCHFDGKRVDAPHTAWKQAVKRAKLPGKVTPHTLRHTRATWLMQAAIDSWQAAGALGMTVRTLESVYGHHHPNWQKDAAEV